MPEPRVPRHQSDVEVIEALAQEALPSLRDAVLRDGGYFGPDSLSMLLFALGRALETGREEAAHWRARAALEGERAEALDRRRRDTERELRALQRSPTPPSFPPPFRPATQPPPSRPSIPREDDTTPTLIPRTDQTRRHR